MAEKRADKRPEKRESWLARWMGAEGAGDDVARAVEEAEATRAQLERQRDLALQRADELNQQHEQAEHAMRETRAALDEATQNLARQSGELAALHGEHEQALAALNQKLTAALEEVTRQRSELELERTKTRTGSTQAQAVHKRLEALQEQLRTQGAELSQLREGHKVSLKKIDELEETLSLREHQMRGVQENASIEHEALTRARAELVALRTVQEQAVLEERQRWMVLVTRFWRALTRTLGASAALPLARELEGESVLGTLTEVSSPELASGALGRTLSELSLCRQVSVSSEGEALEIRLREVVELAETASARGWISVFAVQCLSAMLGKALLTDGVHAQERDLIVRAHYRERLEERAEHLA